MVGWLDSGLTFDAELDLSPTTTYSYSLFESTSLELCGQYESVDVSVVSQLRLKLFQDFVGIVTSFLDSDLARSKRLAPNVAPKGKGLITRWALRPFESGKVLIIVNGGEPEGALASVITQWTRSHIRIRQACTSV